MASHFMKYCTSKRCRSKPIKIITLKKCFRVLQHKNIVKFEGVCYSSFMPANETDEKQEHFSCRKMMIILEFCECSLKEIIFNEKSLQCRYERLFFKFKFYQYFPASCYYNHDNYFKERYILACNCCIL